MLITLRRTTTSLTFRRPITTTTVTPQSLTKPQLKTLMGQELSEKRFDLASCVLNLCNKDNPDGIYVPDMKLKVLIEMIRMVLEVIYDDRFATFNYGGRVGMGRHTAIRYLKNNVENPSWWFNVLFKKDLKFGFHNVDKLCLVIEEKVRDFMFVDLIRKLFELGVVWIELGGLDLGRGLPQECGLNSILVNIYLNVFDQKLQELRLMINKENLTSRLDDNLDNGNEDGDHVFYKPLKVYAVRYLDEILVITSGPKGLTVKLKNLVVEFLTNNLALEVDRARTAVHSAVSEEIKFLGMDLRAVQPVKREIETSNGFKFEFHIEDEVREIFETWGREAVDEFLGSIEERAAWYRKLSGGDFLSLRRIRDQLPVELVDSYDKFQEQVDKYLKPVKARKELEDIRRKEEEDEEQKYTERTVKDLTQLSIKVDAPDQLVRKAVRLAGFTNNMGHLGLRSSLTALEDVDIIKWYAGVGKRWLDYFCCSHNFKIVKTVVTYHLRFSCILTLAEKHESTKREAMKHYTKDLRVFDVDGGEEFHFPTEREIKMMGDKNLADPKPVDGALTMMLIRLASDEPLYRCGAHFCQRSDTIVYRIRLLQKVLNLNPVNEKSWVLGMGVVHGVFE
ncbi:nuclear intron maturase 3, mitochondrial [Tanacetum coccineum]